MSSSPYGPIFFFQDEIFRRKLLIEGDGGQDDKRISNLIRTFIRWYKTDTNSEESEEMQRKIESQLALCEFAVQKSSQVYYMNKDEQKNYEKLNKDIEKQISQAYSKISECKNELAQAKRIRKNRQEYDALAKVIQQQPDREDTMTKMENLQKEIESLKESKEALDKKLDLRRKQFHVLITAIHEMQSILAEDEQKEEGAMDTS